MVSLNCPLCCNETFSSPSSLKSHILNILDKLQCPWCRIKFQKLSELADHLETNCTENFDTKINSDEFEETEDKYDNKSSILAKALLGSPQKESEEVGLYPEESQYYCQICAIHFNDINDHLKNFHEGQEVILEEEDSCLEVIKTDLDETTIFVVESEGEESCEEEEEEQEGIVTVNNSNKRLTTITEHEFKDKEGRLYTRKFVKIDKFWLQKDTENDHEPKIISNENSDNENNQVEDDNLYFTNSNENKNETNCVISSFAVTDIKSLQEQSTAPSSDDGAPKKSNTGPFSCETCGTTFPTFKSLRLHRRMHEPIKKREIEAPSKYGLLENDVNEDPVRQMFICNVCNKTYDKQYETIHMNSHSANNGFNCEVCNKKFFTRANLDMHLKAHSNNKKFTCSYCKKPFVTYDAFNDHLLNQCQKRPYACQFCGRRFARPHEKVKHERIHTGEKPHICEICGKAFRVSYCLTLHLRTHSGTRPYQCKHCGKRFKSHSVYNHHMLTHSDVRAYKCPYCPKAFKTSVQLAGHKNSHIKPFTCTECNRPFASLYAVRAHMETHKRENNLKYECWMCGALYSRAFALRDHLKQQHQQVEGEKAKAVALTVDEEMEATNSILVTEDDIILGLDGATNIEIIENEAE